tara:strand:+ start:67 stop:264 length:198 start_codon:yes stop_codon:yes gene_type:complete
MRTLKRPRSEYPKLFIPPASKACRKRLFKAALRTSRKMGVNFQWAPCANGYGIRAVLKENGMAIK